MSPYGLMLRSTTFEAIDCIGEADSAQCVVGTNRAHAQYAARTRHGHAGAPTSLADVSDCAPGKEHCRAKPHGTSLKVLVHYSVSQPVVRRLVRFRVDRAARSSVSQRRTNCSVIPGKPCLLAAVPDNSLTIKRTELRISHDRTATALAHCRGANAMHQPLGSIGPSISAQVPVLLASPPAAKYLQSPHRRPSWG